MPRERKRERSTADLPASPQPTPGSPGLPHRPEEHGSRSLSRWRPRPSGRLQPRSSLPTGGSSRLPPGPALPGAPRLFPPAAAVAARCLGSGRLPRVREVLLLCPGGHRGLEIPTKRGRVPGRRPGRRTGWGRPEPAPGLTGLGRVAVGRVGLDVDVLHAGDAAAEQGAHGRAGAGGGRPSVSPVRQACRPLPRGAPRVSESSLPARPVVVDPFANPWTTLPSRRRARLGKQQPPVRSGRPKGKGRELRPSINTSARRNQICGNGLGRKPHTGRA